MNSKRASETMSIAWTAKRTASIPMNIDLVQSVAHILVRECLQSKIDALVEAKRIGIENIPSMIHDLSKKLEEHEIEGRLTERAVRMPEMKEMNG